MDRRSFLKAIGLAPAAAMVRLTKPEDAPEPPKPPAAKVTSDRTLLLLDKVLKELERNNSIFPWRKIGKK